MERNLVINGVKGCRHIEKRPSCYLCLSAIAHQCKSWGGPFLWSEISSMLTRRDCWYRFPELGSWSSWSWWFLRWSFGSIVFMSFREGGPLDRGFDICNLEHLGETLSDRDMFTKDVISVRGTVTRSFSSVKLLRSRSKATPIEESVPAPDMVQISPVLFGLQNTRGHPRVGRLWIPHSSSGEMRLDLTERNWYCCVSGPIGWFIAGVSGEAGIKNTDF